MLNLIQIYVFSLVFFNIKLLCEVSTLADGSRWRWKDVFVNYCCYKFFSRNIQYLSVKERSGSLPEILS